MRRRALAPQAAGTAYRQPTRLRSTIEWMPRNALALRHRSARCYDARTQLSIAHEMNQPLRHVLHTASRGAACVGAARVDSGIAPGLAGFETRFDSNRPAMPLAAARGLLKQFGAAH